MQAESLASSLFGTYLRQELVTASIIRDCTLQSSIMEQITQRNTGAE